MTQIDDRVCEGGQEVEISLSRMKDELLEQLRSTQVRRKKKEKARAHANVEHAQLLYSAEIYMRRLVDDAGCLPHESVGACRLGVNHKPK